MAFGDISNTFPSEIVQRFQQLAEMRGRSRNGPPSARHHLHLTSSYDIFRVRYFEERFRQKLLGLTGALKPRANLMTTQFLILLVSRIVLKRNVKSSVAKFR